MWNSAKINNKKPRSQFREQNDDLAQQSSTGYSTRLGTPLASSTPRSSAASRPTMKDQTTKQRRLEYFKNGIDADCEVHVPKPCDLGTQGGNVCYKKFRCHRVFLATASEKLEQDVLLNKQWNGVLQINGVSPESVAIFLEFIYTFEVTTDNINLKIIGDIFILSYAYQLPELLSIFSQKLKEIVWPLEDTFPAFDLAFRNGMLDLENSCLEVGKREFKWIRILYLYFFIYRKYWTTSKN